MFGKNKKKKGILGLKGQAYLDAYNKKMKDTGKTSLAEKYRFTKETSKVKNKLIQQGGR
tara:strand:- start:4496 stop:4672 length:177 start_codon:yes stop_codon:yes gene_type:complete